MATRKPLIAAKTTDTVVDPSFELEKYAVNPTEPVEFVSVEEDVEFPEQTDAEPVDEIDDSFVPLEEVESAADKRIRELEAKLAELAAQAAEATARREVAPVTSEGRPVPVSQLTAEQRQVRNLEDMLARQEAMALRGDVQYAPEVDEDESDVIHFHVLNDGFTALGRVWHRGQEIKISRSSAEYKTTIDRNGDSWLELYDNPKEQFARWHELKFAPGPWYGDLPADVSAADQARGYSVPVARF